MGRALVGAVLAVTFASTGLLAAQAAPAEVSGPVTRVVGAGGASGARQERARQQPAQDRATLARKAEEQGQDVYLSLDPSCAASAKKKARPNGVVYSTRKATFSWVLTSGSGPRRTGTVKAKRDRVTAIKLPTVRTGNHRVVLTEKGTSAPVADQTFDVGLCVGVTKTCHAVRFTNPAANPAAALTYGSGDTRTFDLRLAPGEARTVRVDDKKIFFSAWAGLSDDEGPEVNVGRGTLKVKQSCRAKPAAPTQNAVQTAAVIGCGTASAAAPVTFAWVAQKSLKGRTWQVLDASSRVVAKGSFRDGRDVTVRLAPGTYTYRALANRLTHPFEEVRFSVLRCVEVAPVCRAVEVHNPNAVAVDLLVLDPAVFDDESEVDLGDDPESDQLQERTLAARSGATVAWSHGEAVVLAVDAGLDPWTRFVALASPFPTDAGDDPDDVLAGLPRVVVAQDC